MSHNSADFFIGLSDGVDPTQDLPPVEGNEIGVESENQGAFPSVVGVDKGKHVVDGVPPIEMISGHPVGIAREVVGVIEPPTAVEASGSVGKRKSDVALFPSPKRSHVDDRSTVTVGKHSRPKKLVPSRNLGVMNRRQVRLQQQLIHSSSSGDEYECDTDSGVQRKRVGFLFRTTPHALLPDILTEDDRWKLEGCSVEKRIKRAERATGLVWDSTLLI